MMENQQPKEISAKFVDTSFSRLVFIVLTDRHKDRITHRITDAHDCYTNETTVGVSNYFVRLFSGVGIRDGRVRLLVFPFPLIPIPIVNVKRQYCTMNTGYTSDNHQTSDMHNISIYMYT